MTVYLNALSIITSLGVGKSANAQALFAGARHGLQAYADFLPERPIHLGRLSTPLPNLPADLTPWNSRNNRLLLALIEEIKLPLEQAIQHYGADRVAVILGTSTSGIAEGELALRHYRQSASWPANYHYCQQESGNLAACAVRLLGLSAPAYVVATACASSAKALAAAQRLLRTGACDAVITGGVDTLCRLTVAGFSSLEAVSQERCSPFSQNRDGINIGEGGALFLMTREPSEIALLGTGETSDAYHVSAPNPNGAGATAAIQQALNMAQLHPADMAYINLHGTGTLLNDAMEAHMTATLFENTPCSSTKGLVGHTLGAAGAIEAAFLWLTLHPTFNPGKLLPPHLWNGQYDKALPPLHLTTVGEQLSAQTRLAALSNSFAFGGANAALILGRGW